VLEKGFYFLLSTKVVGSISSHFRGMETGRNIKWPFRSVLNGAAVVWS